MCDEFDCFIPSFSATIDQSRNTKQHRNSKKVNGAVAKSNERRNELLNIALTASEGIDVLRVALKCDEGQFVDRSTC